jgi:hypothetical protein
MKKNVLMLLAVTALLFIGCTKMEQVYPVPSGELSNVPVELSGVINEGGTRAILNEPITGTTASVDLDLSVFRADQTTAFPTVYDSKFDGTFKTTNAVEISPAQYYLIDDNKYTKFIAVYPRVADAQYVKNDKTVEYQINGTTDILASTLVSGKKSAPNTSAMAFSHLLTQVKVKVVADPTLTAPELAAIETIWGKVTGITLSGKNVPALVTLPTPSTTDAATIAQKPSTTATPLALTATHTEGGSLTIPITTTAAEFGYAMFLPVSSGTLTLNISTTKTGATAVTKTTSIAQAFEAGKVYEIKIQFKATGGPSGLVVTVNNTGSLTNWDNTPPTIPENL